MKALLVLGASILLALGIAGSGAFAAAPETCSGGAISGTHGSMVVTGTCTFSGATVRIDGNLMLAPGAILNDHAQSTSVVTVTGNVLVGNGAVLGLGFGPQEETPAFVGGNVIASSPLTLYLGSVTVHGNVVSNGGGDNHRNFPIKDNTIGGNLIIQGWSGQWAGAIRNDVGGNLIFSGNTAADTAHLPGSDSSEVQTNMVGGNLICFDNTPHATVNPDDGGQLNWVSRKGIGECAGLTQ